MYTSDIFEQLACLETDRPRAAVPEGKSGQVEALYRHLKSDLLCATFSPGERLIEERLAERYQASSRTPVREVLARLKSEGHVSVRGRSFISPQYTPAYLLQLYDVRLTLEELAVRGATRSKDTEGLRHCLSIIAAAQGHGSAIAVNAADGLFHLKIAEMSGNEVLCDMLAQIHEKVFQIRNLFFAAEAEQGNVVQEHEFILTAVERGIEDVAIAEMSHHLTESRQKFNDLMN